MSEAVGTWEEEAAWQSWVEDEGRLWAIVLSRKSVATRAKVLFAMNHRDAMALCSDARTKGQGWRIVHSRLENWQEKGRVPDKHTAKDTGRLDPVIEELGLTKIPL